jgi:uncharacterized membrane protein
MVRTTALLIRKLIGAVTVLIGFVLIALSGVAAAAQSLIPSAPVAAIGGMVGIDTAVGITLWLIIAAIGIGIILIGRRIWRTAPKADAPAPLSQ